MSCPYFSKYLLNLLLLNHSSHSLWTIDSSAYMRLLRFCFFVLAAASLGAVAACDSGDPIDDPPSGSLPVTGTYAFTEFSITPDATVIPALNLLDTLVAAQTRLELFPGGDFVLRYRYVGSSPSLLVGRYTYSNREVRLQGDPTESDDKNWRGLLMASNPLALLRPAGQDDVLTSSFRKQVDMGTLSAAYAGIPPLAATVRLSLHVAPE